MWRDFVPVVQYLRNPDMRDRHWAKINEAAGLVIERGEGLTLRTLFDMKVWGCNQGVKCGYDEVWGIDCHIR